MDRDHLPFFTFLSIVGVAVAALSIWFAAYSGPPCRRVPNVTIGHAMLIGGCTNDFNPTED